MGQIGLKEILMLDGSVIAGALVLLALAIQFSSPDARVTSNSTAGDTINSQYGISYEVVGAILIPFGLSAFRSLQEKEASARVWAKRGMMLIVILGVSFILVIAFKAIFPQWYQH